MPKVNFTKKTIEALPQKLTGARAYYWDSKTRGLGIAVTATGKKTFLLYRKIRGRPERINIGPYPDLSVEQARGRASELNAAIARGENPAEQKRAARGQMTLAELFDTYLEKYAKVHKRSWRTDEAQFRRYLTHWTHRKLSEIMRADVRLLHTRVGRLRGHYAANRLLALLHKLFAFASEEGWEQPNPAHGIRRFQEKQRDRFLDAEELRRFFPSLAQEPNPTVRDFLLICLLTGARSGNVKAMRWEEINWNRASWTIPEPKNSEPNTIPLVDEALAVLGARKTDPERNPSPESAYVFPRRDRTRHLADPKDRWRELLRRAKIRDFRLHDLRRTLGSWQAATGASLVVIGKTLGHKRPETTAIYARLDLEPVRKSLTAATRALLTAGGIAPDHVKGGRHGA